MSYLINGWPWGWGCVRSVPVDKAWRCPGCGAKEQMAMERPDGQLVCPFCAEARCKEEFVACPIGDRIGSGGGE